MLSRRRRVRGLPGRHSRRTNLVPSLDFEFQNVREREGNEERRQTNGKRTLACLQFAIEEAIKSKINQRKPPTKELQELRRLL